MNRPLSILIIAALAAALAACSRQEMNPAREQGARVETVGLRVQGGPDTKLSLNGETGTLSWAAGDQIAVHTSAAGGSYKTCPVNPSNNSISILLADGENRDGYAVYPASTVADNSAVAVQITYPASYDLSGYAESALPTLTDARLPMVADNTPGAPLHFYHVGGLIRITLEEVPVGTKTIEATVTGGYVTGTATVTAPGEAGTESTITTGGNVVSFILPGADGLTEARTVVLNIPVPCGTYTALSLEALDKTDGLLHSWADANTRIIAQAKGSRYPLPAFTVDEYGKKVVFARGNLMAKIGSFTAGAAYATASEWKFGEPTEIIGDAADDGNALFTAGNVSCVGKWIDFFSWQGASSNDDATHRVHGLVRVNDTAYKGKITGESPYDGCWNGLPITNGGGYTTWRALNEDEWKYIIEDRPSANSKYGLATVINVVGIILLPDSFLDPNINGGSAAFTPGITDGYNTNTYDDSGWAAMEAAGAVFLPAAGCRTTTIINEVGDVGYYWSTSGRNFATAYNLYFDMGGVWYDEYLMRQRGASVRLARDIE